MRLAAGQLINPTATEVTASVEFSHLRRLTDHNGLFEHADGTAARPEHGYCTDDNARLLALCCHEQRADTADLFDVSLGFVVASVEASGAVRNRMNTRGFWTDQPTTDDCWGRALWGLGTAAALTSDAGSAALQAFQTACVERSPWPRAMAFATIGAAEVTAAHEGHVAAFELMEDTIGVIGLLPAIRSAEWAWPEPRLRYANAVLAEALIAAGHALGRSDAVDSGLVMLDWLVNLQSQEGHLSVVGTEGRGRGRGRFDRQFDQQPIEPAAIADACHRAWKVTGDERWIAGVQLAHGWFMGRNDVGLVMFDPESGGGFDGLHENRVNLNQGAESTLAYVSTMQRFASVCPTA